MSVTDSPDGAEPNSQAGFELRDPPTSLWGALKKIGPGIILAGSIIGTGELLITTKLGADSGFAYLWLIVFSCVIKVFVQIELGRYTISSGLPTLTALDRLPGLRFGFSGPGVHWLVWWWFLMLVCTVFQLGAMVGGVGQALDLAFPNVNPALAEMVGNLWPGLGDHLRDHKEHSWAVLTAAVAVGLLLSGGYKRIESLTTFLVAAVTLITVVCVVALPFSDYPVSWSDLREGFSFTIPAAGIATAFSAFGITGVGASELYTYPYWCIEKGYTRWTGPTTQDEEWVRRARGWTRVLQLDAWVSMVVFSVATVCFYVMGADVLHAKGLSPKSSEMIGQLSVMYVEIFGEWAMIPFLIGASAVLFKTLYVASAGHSRLSADFLEMLGLARYPTPRARGLAIAGFSVFFPCLALVLYLRISEPAGMAIFGGYIQALTLPIICGAAVYLRYRRLDKRLSPSTFADACFLFAVLAITVVAGYSLWDKFSSLWNSWK